MLTAELLFIVACVAAGCAVLAMVRRNDADAAEQVEIDAWLADLRAVRS